MSRIQQAIEKAQAQHGGSIGRSARNGINSQRVSTVSPPMPESHDSGIFRKLAQRISPVDEKNLWEKRVIAASDHDERVGPYRQLRTLLLKTMRDNNWKTLAITSPNERAGKTLTSSNLAISLARNIGTTVLLVDLDLETPALHQILNLEPEKGLVDYLEGRAELDEILFTPGMERLVVLAGRAAGKSSSELLATHRMQHLIQDLCHQDATNITIFDLPPVLRSDDAILFAPSADATLVVVEDGVTTEDQLRQSMQLLDKANVVGTILNKAML